MSTDHRTTSTAPEEEWRPVVGFEGFYEVSSLGRVRSSDARNNRTYPGRIRLLRIDKCGYLSVGLSVGGVHSTWRIHQLVAPAFLGPYPPDCEVNHKDGNKCNPLPDNLEYVSHRQNVRHGYMNGLTKGKKLTEVDAAQIRSSNEPNPILAERFGVDKCIISMIRNGRRWNRSAW